MKIKKSTREFLTVAGIAVLFIGGLSIITGGFNLSSLQSQGYGYETPKPTLTRTPKPSKTPKPTPTRTPTRTPGPNKTP